VVDRLDFSKVTSRVGSKDNIRHKPGGKLCVSCRLEIIKLNTELLLKQSGGRNKIFDQKLQWQAEAKIPKPDRMSSLTRKLSEVSVKDKPAVTKELEEDADANPFLTNEPESLIIADQPHHEMTLPENLEVEGQEPNSTTKADQLNSFETEYEASRHAINPQNEDIEVL
jgi:hypothetical protein